MKDVQYEIGADINTSVFIELLKASTLGERRPIHNRDVMKAILDRADIVVSAWSEDLLIGIATTLTDFHRVAYLADLAVHLDWQKQGVGKELVRRTRAELETTCSIVLLASPKANDYYGKIGFEHNPRAWVLDSETEP